MTSNSSVVSQRCNYNHTLCDLADEIRTQHVIRSTKMQCLLLDNFFSTIKRKMLLNATNSFKNMKSNWSTSAFHKFSAPLYFSMPDLSCQDSASLGVSLKKPQLNLCASASVGSCVGVYNFAKKWRSRWISDGASQVSGRSAWLRRTALTGAVIKLFWRSPFISHLLLKVYFCFNPLISLFNGASL